MIIMTDTPSLFSPAEKNDGVVVIPACTVVDSIAYKDFEDMDTDIFLKRLEDGVIATSSQPAIGEIMEAYEEHADSDIIVLPIGAGLSGTYDNMESAKKLAENGERIHIVNTKTLAGPQNYLVKKAIALRDSGLSTEDIVKELEACIESTVSFVIPFDFNFLKRSGRLTPFAAKLGTIMKLVPVMTQPEDKRKITKFCIKTSKKSAFAAIIDHLKELSVGAGYLISVCHGGGPEEAEACAASLRESFEGALVETHLLPPSLVCHGGPGCILIQAVKM